MGTRRTNATQSALAQLQDNQRTAMTLIANVGAERQVTFRIRSLSNSAVSAPRPSRLWPCLAARFLDGTYNAAAPGDTLVARFFAPPNDTSSRGHRLRGAEQCGRSRRGSGTQTCSRWPNVNGTWWLQCQSQTSGVAGPLVNLIPNVTNMSVLYGVAASTAGDDYSVVQYLNATQ